MPPEDRVFPNRKTLATGHRLEAGFDLSLSISVKSKRLELGFPGGVLHSSPETSAVEPGEGQMGNVGLMERSNDAQLLFVQTPVACDASVAKRSANDDD